MNVWYGVGCVGVVLPPPRDVAAVLIGWEVCMGLGRGLDCGLRGGGRLEAGRRSVAVL